MKIQKFEDIIAWQKAQEHAVFIYACFNQLNDYGFKNQICRAVVSISNNIAEGYNRQSNKEFSRFLYIALGSASEVKSMAYLAYRLQYISAIERDKILDKTSEIGRLIQGFIKSLRKPSPS